MVSRSLANECTNIRSKKYFLSSDEWLNQTNLQLIKIYYYYALPDLYISHNSWTHLNLYTYLPWLSGSFSTFNFGKNPGGGPS